MFKRKNADNQIGSLGKGKKVYKAHTTDTPPGATAAYDGYSCDNCGARRMLYSMGKHTRCIRGYGCNS
jgi:hypothetical protein